MAAAHDALDLDQAAATLKFPNLAVDEVGGKLPDGPACPFGLQPVTEVGGQYEETKAETVGGEDGPGKAGLLALVQFVDDGVGQVEGARAEAEDRDDLGGGLGRGPDPDVVASLADIGPEFIELNVGTLQVLKEVPMVKQPAHAVSPM